MQYNYKVTLSDTLRDCSSTSREALLLNYASDCTCLSFTRVCAAACDNIHSWEYTFIGMV